MITEDYVSFEVAKLLKEKGFQQLQDNCGYFTTEMIYSINVDDNGEHHFAHQYPAGVYNKDKYIAAPTLQMAMKWLREVHNIVCNIDIESRNFYYYGIFIIRSSVEAQYQLTSQKPYFETYEEACEAAIKHCLENLI